jgi:hypothetical protein
VVVSGTKHIQHMYPVYREFVVVVCGTKHVVVVRGTKHAYLLSLLYGICVSVPDLNLRDDFRLNEMYVSVPSYFVYLWTWYTHTHTHTHTHTRYNEQGDGFTH